MQIELTKEQLALTIDAVREVWCDRYFKNKKYDIAVVKEEEQALFDLLEWLKQQ